MLQQRQKSKEVVRVVSLGLEEVGRKGCAAESWAWDSLGQEQAERAVKGCWRERGRETRLRYSALGCITSTFISVRSICLHSYVSPLTRAEGLWCAVLAVVGHSRLPARCDRSAIISPRRRDRSCIDIGRSVRGRVPGCGQQSIFGPGTPSMAVVVVRRIGDAALRCDVVLPAVASGGGWGHFRR